MSDWQDMSTAPRDGTHLLLLTSDFGMVEGWWDERRIDFYKSQKGWASYEPSKALGTWVAHYTTDPLDNRMYCGSTPTHWQPLPAPPTPPPSPSPEPGR